jgi:hypothetical protein
MLYWYNIPVNGRILTCKSHDPFNFAKKIATFGITSYYAFGFSEKFVTESKSLPVELGKAFIAGFLFDGANSHNKASFVQGLGGAFIAFWYSKDYSKLKLLYEEDGELIEQDHWERQGNLTENIGWSDDSG